MMITKSHWRPIQRGVTEVMMLWSSADPATTSPSLPQTSSPPGQDKNNEGPDHSQR